MGFLNALKALLICAVSLQACLHPQPAVEQVPEGPKPVICQVPQQCGGGSIPLKEWECKAIVCCSTNGKWTAYYDGRKCETPKAVQPTKVQLTQAVGNKIDCTGPDGKHLQITQKECDDFNAAWGNKPKPVVQQTQQSGTQVRTATNNVYCWNNTYKYSYYTTSGDQCNQDNTKSAINNICYMTQNSKKDTCWNQCKAQLDKDNGLCAWAYTGQNAGVAQDSGKYGECLNGPGGTAENYDKCLSACGDQYAKDLQSCK